MDQSEVQQLFCRFSAPLAVVVALGGRKEAADTIARALWTAMIAGEETEASVWKSMEDTQSVDPAMLTVIRRFYEEEMRPQVSQEQIAELRERYNLTSTGAARSDEPSG